MHVLRAIRPFKGFAHGTEMRQDALWIKHDDFAQPLERMSLFGEVPDVRKTLAPATRELFQLGSYDVWTRQPQTTHRDGWVLPERQLASQVDYWN